MAIPGQIEIAHTGAKEFYNFVGKSAKSLEELCFESKSNIESNVKNYIHSSKSALENINEYTSQVFNDNVATLSDQLNIFETSKVAADQYVTLVSNDVFLFDISFNAILILFLKLKNRYCLVSQRCRLNCNKI